MKIGQSSRTGRYPSTMSQVRHLLEHVGVEGSVLNACGARGDAVSLVLGNHGLRVVTNDLNAALGADYHLDAGSDAFREVFTEEAVRPAWVVTSPPYRHAFCILVQALRVARAGVAFKLRLSFLEPTKTRGDWLKANPPSAIVVLPRAVYRGRTCHSTEAWVIWHIGASANTPRKQAIFFSTS